MMQVSHRVPRRLAAASGLLLLAAFSSRSLAYPLDGGERTGIRRLAGDQAIRAGKVPGHVLPEGAGLGLEDIRLHLVEEGSGFDIVDKPRDESLQRALESIFAERDPSYGVTVIDYTDPANVRWAALRGDLSQYPGSVGKTLTMVGFFDALARAFPKTADREKLLREHVVEADAWVQWDSHGVPRYDPESGRNRYARIEPGDRFTLAEWIDHMVSPSANAAGAMVWKEAMLLRHFGSAYPVSKEREAAFFKETPKSELQALSIAVSADALAAAGLDTEAMRQGSLWTAHGKSVIPGVASSATPRELARLLLRLEQGRLVDRWSSLEMKRYLYFTKKRYRYAYPRELHPAAVYFKSGSLYACTEEKGFSCGKYKGNEKNYMNSIAIVEQPARPKEGERQRRYAVALMSNVLRKNSAWDHARLAAAIDEAVRTRSDVKVDESGPSRELREAGSSH